jgi:uncharacterized protein YcfL
MKMVMQLAMVVMVILLASGCRRLRPSSAGIQVESYPHNRITVNSKMFGERFRVTECATAKTEAGRLQATVSLENSGGDCQFQYRYRWLNKDGIEVKSGSSVWVPMSAGSKEVKLLSGVAPELSVEDYILDIRFSYGSTRW